ncbi:unnamed protein product [Musa acuminata subsp. malaccensis]|uniref:(wild Malaysian banana) hypothetical protein n=1 Tax=Musa acuminata subsp. malaccensis TaxID=214687 RepID=A0A804KSC6_MUSAM|nr:PREDICTED: uncharacterized protein LOC103999945 isoform X2 [Musa acuminata subsp. malaccensis]CAG1852747.1 unnamed protein product [Musa acuminata subsp. malaccensis]
MSDGCFLKRIREEMNEEEEKGAERLGARRQSAFIVFESHRPVRSCSTRKQRILKMEISALVLACGLRVGADESRGLELMEPIIGPCMSSRSDLSTMPSAFFSILTTPSLWLRDHLTYPGFVNVFFFST